MKAAAYMPAADIARRLASRAEALAREMLPNGHREGYEWRAGSVAGEPGDSLGVHLTGPKAGVWCDFAVGQGGDLLDLIAATRHLSIGEAMQWAKHCLGIDNRQPHPRRAPPPRRQLVAPVPPAKAVVPDTGAIEIWRAAYERFAGSPADIYLRSRGLDPARLYSLHGSGQWPATLRYSERAAQNPAQRCSALVIAVHDQQTGLVGAIHRILLHPDGSPVLKDDGKKKKLALGPIIGNAARFDYWPGEGDDGRWGLAEGVENALAAYQLTGIPTWAAISAGNMKNVSPPAWARHAIIFADHDAAGRIAASAAAQAFRRYPKLKTVRIWGNSTPDGDAADLIRGAANG